MWGGEMRSGTLRAASCVFFFRQFATRVALLCNISGKGNTSLSLMQSIRDAKTSKQEKRKKNAERRETEEEESANEGLSDRGEDTSNCLALESLHLIAGLPMHKKKLCPSFSELEPKNKKGSSRQLTKPRFKDVVSVCDHRNEWIGGHPQLSTRNHVHPITQRAELTIC